MPAAAAPADEEGAVPADDARTLWVDYDDHGERHKRWRSVVQESSSHVYADNPLEGPGTALHLMKHMERQAGDPRLWRGWWQREKRLEPSDRVMHEMTVLTDCLFFAGVYDQVNIGGLVSLEVIARRIQLIVDAYGNPMRPNWDNAKFFSGHAGPEDAVSPQFRAWASRRAKDEAEVTLSRAKVRELRGAPVHGAAAEEGAGDGNAQPAAGAGGRGRGRGRGPARGAGPAAQP